MLFQNVKKVQKRRFIGDFSEILFEIMYREERFSITYCGKFVVFFDYEILAGKCLLVEDSLVLCKNSKGSQELTWYPLLMLFCWF